MHVAFALPALTVALLALTACDADLAFPSRYTSDFHYSYPLSATGRVEVEGFNGAVEIAGWDENTVDISGTKFGRTQQLADRLKIDINHTGSAITIRAVKPAEGFWGGSGVRFQIRMPRKALLDRAVTSNGALRVTDLAGTARLRTSNGTIRATHVEGEIDAQTSNAAIELVDATGDVSAHTSNGSVSVDQLQGGLDASTSNGRISATITRTSRPVRVQTSNGSIDLTLPDGFNQAVRAGTSNAGVTLRLPQDLAARISVHTSNSSIECDYPVTAFDGRRSKHELEGVIGAGGPLVEVTTSNGGVHLVKR
jgi:hypothetical protein